jgi:hypothetical protein
MDSIFIFLKFISFKISDLNEMYINFILFFMK